MNRNKSCKPFHMVRILIRRMLAAQIFSALTVSLCLLIDSIMISRFLGETGSAAYTLANPLLLAIGAVGTLLSAGVQVVCSKALGKGSHEDANAGYSSALATGAAVSAVFLAAVLLLSPFLARVLGAGREGELYRETRGYLIGYTIGAPGSIGALVLVPFLQMAGQSGLLIAAVLTMTVTDVAFDLLNVLVFHGGMFGMGLASALSYYAALLVGGAYLISKKSIFRFSRRGVTRKTIAEIFRNGIPAGVNMFASVILVFALNRLLERLGGNEALAAYMVIMSIGNSANCVTTGIGGVSLTLSGVFFHEEDRSSLKAAVKMLLGRGVVLGLGVGALIALFAPALVSVFIAEESGLKQTAVLGLRLYAAGMMPCCVNNALKYCYQGTGRPRLTEILSLLEGAVFPVLAAVLLSLAAHTTGVWLAFVTGELMTLLLIALLIRKITGRKPWEDGAYLLLKDDFGAAPGETMEREIRTVEDATAAAEAAEAFCRSRGENERVSRHIALCMEEMAVNVVQYGFREGEDRHLSVLLLNKPEHWVLRFRDDCRAFDPLRYTPRDPERSWGIRLVRGITQDAHYSYAMNLNNLALELKKGSAGEAESFEI